MMGTWYTWTDKGDGSGWGWEWPPGWASRPWQTWHRQTPPYSLVRSVLHVLPKTH